MTAGRSPKFPNTINPSGMRMLNPAALRSALGLGTIATQNSNNVNISGGNISNANFNGGQFSGANLYYPYISGATSLSVSGNATLNSKLLTTPVVYTSNNAVLGNEIVSIIRPVSDGGICTGSPTNACSTYSYDSCPTILGCSPTSVYCPDYNGNYETCISYGCTTSSTTLYCSDYYWYDESTCNTINASCTYTPPTYVDCATTYFDESSCNADPNCSGWQDGYYCAGSYESSPASCTGSWEEWDGNCSGEGGYCSGTASCDSVPLESCESYAGCDVIEGLTINVPSAENGQHRYIKSAAEDNTDIFLNFSDKYQDGTNAKTLASYGNFVAIIFETRYVGCSTLYDNETACNNDSECTWNTENSVCEGTKNESRWWDFS
jgi:hypothetical protein